jgi:hypothetical protein
VNKLRDDIVERSIKDFNLPTRKSIMKRIKLSVLLLTVITCNTKLAPAYAGTVEKETSTSKTEIQSRSTKTTTSEQNPQVDPLRQNTPKTQRRIPAAAAIAISFPQELVLNADAETATTLMTAQPVYDEDGNEATPANSLVSVRLRPTKGGIEIVADSLIVRGRTISLRASSIVVPGQTVTLESGAARAREASQIGSRLGGSIFGAINSNDSNGMKSGALGGSVIGMIVGLTSPKNATIVKIPQGSIYVLSVQSPVSLP